MIVLKKVEGVNGNLIIKFESCAKEYNDLKI